MKAHITDKLNMAIKLSYIKVTNESHLHNTPSDAESHFKVILVSNDFINQNLVKRHQLVYRILSKELSGSVHALALHAFTEDEWEKRQEFVLKTPNCLGGKQN